MNELTEIINSRKVVVARDQPKYLSRLPFDPSERYPEYQGLLCNEDNPGFRAVRSALWLLGDDNESFGTTFWNPLKKIVFPGDRVVVKPNWVSHKNHGEHIYNLKDTDSLITHGSIIRAVLEYICIALKGKGKVVIGDAPIQSADWNEILRLSGAVSIIERLAERFKDIQFELVDFRIEHAYMRGNRVVGKKRRAFERAYVEVDLGSESLLDSLIHSRSNSFGVADYSFHRMREAHQHNRHIFPFYRDVLEFNVLINLPKIKTHRMAGISCALKNIFGTIVMKDYLPHFLLGSPYKDGDEYPNGNWLWDLRWWFEHKLWNCNNGIMNFILWVLGRACSLGLHQYGYTRDYYSLGGGSWFGNDTLWRTILDVNRAFFYFDRSDGSISKNPKRSIRYIAIADGLIGGHKEAPLCPTPIGLGFVLGARNPVALDVVAAKLIGFDINKIPQIREAFQIKQYPLTLFQPNDIEVVGLKGVTKLSDVYLNEHRFICEPSMGWKNNIEYKEIDNERENK